MTPSQISTLRRHAFRKGQSGNPHGNGREWYLKRYGILFRGELRLSSEIAKLLGISDRQVRNRVRAGWYERKTAIRGINE